MNLSLREQAANLREGRIDLMDHVQAALRLVESREAELQALLPEENRRERLFGQASELLKRYPGRNSRPPLFGVLVGVKDLYTVSGLPTRAGSNLPAEAFAGPEAALVTRLKDAGALILGKTVSTEFAYFSPGPTRNPLDPRHTPGGSSSGSAAAVAAGYCPLALGTQTIASVIRPASYCGICGFKPSWGRVSLDGVFPFSQTADHAGWFGLNVDDLRFAASIIIPGGKSFPQLPKPRLGIVSGPFLAQAEAAAQNDFRTQINKLAKFGYECLPIYLFDDIEAVNAIHRRLIAAEFSRNHQLLWPQYSSLYSPPSRELYESGLQVPETELPALRENTVILREKIGQKMREFDLQLILSPATTGSAPRGLQSTGSPLMSLPFNHAGLPLLTLPGGKDNNGLPFGVQICGGLGEDEYLLATAREIEILLRT